MAKRLSKGFTLVELLIVVAIIGIIAAIAIPNLITAIQRGKQKRSVADLRNIGTAIEEYIVDESWPPITAPGPITTGLNIGEFVPFYIKVLPLNDGWRRLIDWTQAGAGTTSFNYSIYSLGRDRAANALNFGLEYDNKSFSYDIYFSDGQLTWAPQQK